MISEQDIPIQTAVAPRLWNLKYALEWLVTFCSVLAILPMLVLLALLVKVTSPGPVFYVSSRLGRNGRAFRLYKFRSMKTGVSAVIAPDGKIITAANDPRFTAIGKFLRLGFDELPQLFNVLKGDMCLVGPRPDIPEELERYNSRERLRLLALPGITGLTQVLDGRNLSNADNYELDVRYVTESNFSADLLIVLFTLPYAFGFKSLPKRFLGRFLNRKQASQGATVR